MRDTSAQPTVAFSRASVALTEGTQTTTGNPVNVVLGAGKTGTDDDPDGMDDLTNVIQFTTSPEGAAVT